MATGLFNLKQVNQAISQGAWSGYIAPKWVEYLVVAGGGGAGVSGGGGGGGGLLTGIVTVAAGTSYTVTVGSGGAGGTSAGTSGSSGVASVFGSLSVTGGGGGGSFNSGATTGNSGLSGGSGGGGASGYTSINAGTAGQGTANQGNAGNISTGSVGQPYSAGGGGGAGTIGLSGISNGASGNGGAGIASSISGTVTAYAGGGAGGAAGSASSPNGIGGVGGGGSAQSTTYTASGYSGSSSLGGGGGGGWGASGGAGGSGIVVVRYPGSVQFFTGGTLSYANGYMIHTFYASGTLAPTTPTPYVTDYQISRSLRFNSADSANLTRTPATATNQKTWTWSGWVKRGGLSIYSTFFAAGSNGFTVRFNSPTDYLEIYNYSGGYQLQLITAQVFRDPSAWYHIVVALDTTQATDTNRIKLYVNGSQVTSFYTTPTYPSQNADLFVNGTNVHALGVLNTIGQYYDGLLTEVNFIDGQALTPSSFGYTDPDTGVWSPLAFVGTYGTNGFYLNFSDNSNTTAATLGKDYSGNGNNFTPNNFSVTAGAGNDSFVDSPTSYGTDTGVGGEVRGNYATWNAALQILGGTSSAYTNGNLVAASSNSNWVLGTIRVNDAKYYFELVPDSNATSLYLGLNYTTDVRITAYSGGIEASPGGGSNQGSLAAWSNGDVIGVAVDGPNKTVQFYRNGSTYGTLVTYTTALDLFPFARNGGVGYSQVTANFGQRPFAYTAPSGYKALCTQNLPTPTIGATTATQANLYFNPVLYTGTGANGNAITVGFQPDFTWLKGRSNAQNHGLFDAVRGAGKGLQSNSTGAEYNLTDTLHSFNSNGFTVNNDSTFNGSGYTYVGWNWKANGSGSTNTAGSITSTVSANTTSGFSVVTYTGDGSNSTVGHGLGVAPKFIILKQRNQVDNWLVYSEAIGAANFLRLNTTGASTSGTPWQSTTPTSSVVYLGSGSTSQSGWTYVMYCFAEVAGYSKFGSYTGNGSADGPFVFTGMRPAFLMLKRSDNTSDWFIYDTTRSPYNAASTRLYPDLSVAEDTGGSLYDIDFLSNGFKLRGTGQINSSGSTWIFMALASNPFKYSLAR